MINNAATMQQQRNISIQHPLVISVDGIQNFSILPNSNNACPMRSCYTLLCYGQPFKLLHFQYNSGVSSTEGQLLIENVNNISLVGGNDNSTMIKCVGEFGLVFINITNLTVSNSPFRSVGLKYPMYASQLSTSLNEILQLHLYCPIISFYNFQIPTGYH